MTEIPPTNTEMYKLLKLKIIEDVQSDLLAWVKHRLWFVLLLIAAVAYLGPKIIVGEIFDSRVEKEIKGFDPLIRTFEKQTKDAKEATTSAKTAASEATEAATKANKAAKTALTAKNMEVFRSELNKLGVRLRGIEANIKSAEMERESILTQVRLSAEELNLVAAIVTSEPAESTEKEDRLKEFQDHSTYVISVVVYGNRFAPNAQEIVRRLRVRGFTVNLSEQPGGANTVKNAQISSFGKGEEQLPVVIDELKGIPELHVIPISRVDLTLPGMFGDIQIVLR